VSRPDRSEVGTSLVELVVAVSIMAIALAVTLVIVVSVDTDAGGQLAQGRATETAQVSLDGMTQFLAGAVTPLQAYAAQGNPAGVDPTSGYCWNDVDPGPATTASPASPLIGSDPHGSLAAPSEYPAGTKEVDPAALSIIYAHDYDVELCAYPPNSTTPQVYELFVNDASCVSSTSLCNVEVVRFGTTSDPYNAAQDYQSAEPAAAENATVVDVVHHVWCDQACQAGTSCWSYLPTVAGASQTPPASCSGISTGTEAQFTPPLFTYLGGPTQSGATNVAATHLDLDCAPAASAGSTTCDPTVVTSSTGPVCDAAAAPGSGVTTDDTLCLVDAAIDTIGVQMVVRGNTESSAPTQVAASTRIVVDQSVDLPNLAAQEQP